MSKSKFTQEKIVNLVKYKLGVLKISQDGVFMFKKEKIKLGHILPDKDKKLNIISTYRDYFYNSELAKIKFHRFFHHLNSSQAMCINFFYPLIKEEKLNLILEKIGLKNEKINYKKVIFEKESNIENDGRRTSFDFYIETINGKKLFFEIKYTENEFAKAKCDEEHKNKYINSYKNKTEVLKKEYRNSDDFLKNYQLMRNIINVTENNYVIFIFPDKNLKIKRQAEGSKDFVVNIYKENIINLTWEDLFEFVYNNISNNNTLKTHFNEFKKKYLE